MAKSDNVTYRALQKIKIEIIDSEEMTSGMDGDEGPRLLIEVEDMPEFLDVIVPKE